MTIDVSPKSNNKIICLFPVRSTRGRSWIQTATDLERGSVGYKESLALHPIQMRFSLLFINLLVLFKSFHLHFLTRMKHLPYARTKHYCMFLMVDVCAKKWFLVESRYAMDESMPGIKFETDLDQNRMSTTIWRLIQFNNKFTES